MKRVSNSASFHSNDDSDLPRDFNFVSKDEVVVSAFAQSSPVYRAVAVAEAPRNIGFQSSMPAEVDYLGKPSLRRERDSKSPVASSSSSVHSQQSKQPLLSVPKEVIKASDPPEYLVSTHFYVETELELIVSDIGLLLHDISAVSFDFDATSCQWTVVYVNGSTNCKFQVIVYSKTPGYIVEGNRLRGECYVFRKIFHNIQERLTRQVTEFREIDSYAAAAPLPSSCPPSNEADTMKCVECVLRMARECTYEAQLEAMKIICEFSTDPGLRQILVDRGVLQVIRDNIENSNCHWAPQHAMVALSNFAEASIFQSAIIKEGFLPILLSLATDGPFDMAELRRVAVHILATLCNDNPSEVARALKKQDVTSWIDRVDSIKDERLRVGASRARESLRVVFAC